MGAIPKTTGHSLYFLDLAVDRLAQGVRDPMPRTGDNIVHLCLYRLGHLLLCLACNNQAVPGK
jgi:hypothetical protein